jgi:hypothetical protein
MPISKPTPPPPRDGQRTRPICEQAKSASPGGAVFTNRGDADSGEVPVKPTKRLTRVPFKVSRLMEFCTRRELINQTGHNTFEWPLVVLEELADNALDDAEEAEIAPVISVAVKSGSITVRDNGSGIPADTIKGILDYAVRVLSREAYVSPTRTNDPGKGHFGQGGGGTNPAAGLRQGQRQRQAARQLMYAARGHIQRVTGQELNANYFTQSLLPDYLTETGVTWDVAHDARGHFNEPHDGRGFGIGTLEVRSYLKGFHDPALVGADVNQATVDTFGPSGNFGAVLFIEKEGFSELLHQRDVLSRRRTHIMYWFRP